MIFSILLVNQGVFLIYNKNEGRREFCLDRRLGGRSKIGGVVSGSGSRST